MKRNRQLDTSIWKNCHRLPCCCSGLCGSGGGTGGNSFADPLECWDRNYQAGARAAYCSVCLLGALIGIGPRAYAMLWLITGRAITSADRTLLPPVVPLE